MVAPGVPTSVAHDIAAHEDDPQAMARAVVGDVMHAQFDSVFGPLRPAAAFDVLDLNSPKIARAESAIKRFNDDASSAAANAGTRDALRDDVRSIEGMVRFPEAGKDMPWHADRPALSVYGAVASDARLAPELRNDARSAREAVRDLVLAHRESRDFRVFDDADYRDAAGPTIHVPTSRAQIDPWASKGISETQNAFYDAVDEGKLVRAIA